MFVYLENTKSPEIESLKVYVVNLFPVLYLLFFFLKTRKKQNICVSVCVCMCLHNFASNIELS